MIRRPPRSTRTDTLLPYTTLFRSAETTGAIHGERGRAISSRPRLADDDWPRLGRRMTEVAEAVAARGLDLVYHHHMGTVVESAGDIHALMAASGPAVKLLLDTGHATFAGDDPVALARRYRERPGHVPCKDQL